MQIKKKNSILVILLSVFFITCNKHNNELELESQILTPLIQTSIGIDDIFADSLITKDNDNAINFSYQYQLAVDSIGNFFKVNDTLNEQSVSLTSLVLDNKKLSDTVTLKEIYPESRFLDGKTVVLPAQNITPSNVGQEIDVSKQFFKQAKFKKGYMDITLNNDLPVAVELIIFKLYNKLDLTIIISDTFKNIGPFGSEFKSISLAGKKVEGILVGEITKIITKESDGEVLIDADKGVRVDLYVHDLQPEYATAVFPAQNLLEENVETEYNLGGAKITYMKIKKGFVLMTVYSNIQEELILNYKIPQSWKNGNYDSSINKIIKVAPAPAGKFTKIEKLFPLDGYEVLFKGKEGTSSGKYSTVYSEFTASIEYTGIERTISLRDSVYIKFGLIDIEPSLAIGDFGGHIFQLNNSYPIKAFKNITGNISLEDIKMNLLLNNSFGIQSSIDVYQLNGLNTRTNNSVKLIHPELSSSIFLNRATNPPFTPYVKNINFTKTNSNLKQFVENMPDEIQAKMKLHVNPIGADITDFVFDFSKLTATLNIDAPIYFGAEGLKLEKTEKFNFSQFEKKSKIKSGKLNLICTNGFPCTAKVMAEFLDSNNVSLASFFPTAEGGKIIEGEIDLTTNKVSKAFKTVLSSDFSEAKMNLIRHAKKIKYTIILDTPSGNRYKWYDSYKIDMKITGDFIFINQF